MAVTSDKDLRVLASRLEHTCYEETKSGLPWNQRAIEDAIFRELREVALSQSSRVQELEEALRLMVDESSPTGVPNRLTRDTFKLAERALAGKKEGNNG